MNLNNFRVVDHFFNSRLEDVYYLENVEPKFRETFEIILDVINNHFDCLFDILKNHPDEYPNLTRYIITSNIGKEETAEIALAYAYHLTMRHNGDPFKAWEWGLISFENYYRTMRSGFEKLDLAKVMPLVDRITKILINQRLSITSGEFRKLAHYDIEIGEISKSLEALKKSLSDKFLNRLIFRNDIREIDEAFDSLASLRIFLDPAGNPSIDNWKKYEEFAESDTVSQYDFASTQVIIKDYTTFKAILENKLSYLRRLEGRIKYNLGL